MAIEVETRKWGNSIAIILPSEFVKERNIKPKERFLIEPMKIFDAHKVAGMLKRTTTGQKFKDEMRRAWGR